MAKYKFKLIYGIPLPPNEVSIEAEDEDQAWEKFDQQFIQPLRMLLSAKRKNKSKLLDGREA